MEDKKNEKTKAEPLSEDNLDQVSGGTFVMKTYRCNKCNKDYNYRICPVHKIDLAATTR